MSVKLLALHLGLPFAFEEDVLGAEVTVDDALPGTPLGLLAEGSEARAEVLHHRQGIRLPHPGDGAQELVPKLTRLLGAGLRVWYLTAAQKLFRLGSARCFAYGTGSGASLCGLGCSIGGRVQLPSQTPFCSGS